MPYVVEPMQLEDVQEVAEVERHSFSTPWPVQAYRRELKENRNSRYIVVRRLEPENGREASGVTPAPEAVAAVQAAGGSSLWRAVSRLFRREERPAATTCRRGYVVGYAGVWIILDEAHVTTIAVAPEYRGKGIGELLLVRLIEIAQELGAERMTLEVRLSNEVAQNLYRKYMFSGEGVRRHYYSDDNEDALIMWSEPIHSANFQRCLEERREALLRRLGSELAA